MTTTADVVVTANGEGTRATILRWCKSIGDSVAKDEPLVELETDKVTVEIAAPVAGTLVEIFKDIDVEVEENDVLARLQLAGGTRDAAAPVIMEPAVGSAISSTRAPIDSGVRGRSSRTLLSPSVRRLLQEHGVHAVGVVGTGRNGRITAQDVIRSAAEAKSSLGSASPGGEKPESIVSTSGVSRVAHSAIRRRVAEHMVRSMTEAPHVTTLFEADLSRVLMHRAKHAAEYENRGARLTLTAYFVSACGRALRSHPEVNATFNAEALELHREVNVGVGTSLGDKGLIVPVIHGVPELSLFGIAMQLGRAVEAARAGKLTPADVRGGTFTISNHGVGGSLLAAPIVINQPQVAILGVGKVERRVRVLGLGGAESIGIRSMCYLTLSIDHRALDAFQANAFLSSIVEALQEWPLVEE